MKTQKLERSILDHYHCEITDFIWKNSNWKDDKKNKRRIYICGFDDKYHAIRITGSTIGCIGYDDNNIIIEIRLYDNPIWIKYDDGINEKLKKFIGDEIRLEEV